MSRAETRRMWQLVATLALIATSGVVALAIGAAVQVARATA